MDTIIVNYNLYFSSLLNIYIADRVATCRYANNSHHTDACHHKKSSNGNNACGKSFVDT